MTLEKLLNILCEKGWKPFGIYGNGELEGERICIEEQTDTNEYRNKVYWINVDYVEFNGLCDEDKQFSDRFSLREIISKGSGLWQFVCENGMVHLYTKHQIIIQEDDIITTYRPDYIFHDDEYYIIQSALKDESELEEFLLQNIKID